MVYLGLDPGVSGGIAILREDGSIVRVVKMPNELQAIIDVLTTDIDSAVAVLEHVWSQPGWGHNTSFAFGRGYGRLEMALTAAAIPYEQIVPRRWQPAMGVKYPKGKPRDKNISKRRAQRLFPKISVTHANADALLIAEYCRRLKTGTLQRWPRPKGRTR